jgi:hypothetical protein
MMVRPKKRLVKMEVSTERNKLVCFAKHWVEKITSRAVFIAKYYKV